MLTVPALNLLVTCFVRNARALALTAFPPRQFERRCLSVRMVLLIADTPPQYYLDLVLTRG